VALICAGTSAQAGRIASDVARLSGRKWIKLPTRDGGRGLSGLPVSSGDRNLDRGDRQVDAFDLHAGT
jgi:hypothetical protein